MSTGCEFSTIKTFESALSAADFESTVEITNFPAVFEDVLVTGTPFLSGIHSTMVSIILRNVQVELRWRLCFKDCSDFQWYHCPSRILSNSASSI